MGQRKLLASYFTIAGNINPLEGDTASPFDIQSRAQAAAAAGFAGIGLFHTDLQRWLEKYDMRSIKKILDDHGLKHVELEFIFDWYSTGDTRKEADVIRGFLLDAAGQLGAWHIKIGGDLQKRWPTDYLIGEFARLCDDALAAGTRISLEMAPVTTIDSLDLVMDIVEGAARVNGGYMLDIWHIHRAAVDLADLAKLPRGKIFGVELNDASSVVRGSLLEDTLHNRRFCGEGDFKIEAFVAAVEAAGFRGPYGVEITSDALRKLPLAVAASRSFETTNPYLP